MENNPNSELSQFMNVLQDLSVQNSDLNTEFAETLAICREMCANNLTKMFEADFELLMSETVETLTLNLKAKIDPIKENTENQEHAAKMKEIESQIQKIQEDSEVFAQKKDHIISFVNKNIMNI